MKKISFAGITILLVFIIYLFNIDKKTYYLVLGEKDKNTLFIKNYLKEKEVLEKYNTNYANSKDRITDIYNKIINNSKSKQNTIKNSLIKADLLTLKINIDDIYEKINDSSVTKEEIYNYIDELTKDFEQLLKIIRNYCKENIFFIGFNIDNKQINNYLNKKFKEKCKNYDIIYLKNNQQIKNTILKQIDKHLFEG